MSSTTTKRKSTGTSGRASKKTRTENNYDATRAVVSDILADPDAYPVPEDDVEIRKLLVDLAQYARALEGQVAASAPQEVSKEDLEAATEKIRKAAAAGIKKQMSVRNISKGLSSRHYHHSRIVYKWKPSCKTSSAKWVYDGVCPDADVFGNLMGMDGPPKWKTKKLTVDEFEKLVGRIQASARFASTLFYCMPLY